MAETKQYRVIRRHMGDRFYEVGDIREAAPGEVKSLVGKVLEEAGDVKSETAPLNKAEPAASEGKAATGRKGKKA